MSDRRWLGLLLCIACLTPFMYEPARELVRQLMIDPLARLTGMHNIFAAVAVTVLLEIGAALGFAMFIWKG